jgi:hypothetical protein
MAAAGLKNFKEVIQNKAYRINPNDRKIFEEGDLQTFFGLSEDDIIEFIMYDISENQLPQKGHGLVRYISLNNQNIRDYFLIAEGTVMTKNNLPAEYFIDVERLINEAGYANGLFKTQVSLLNKRVGSFQPNDKLWIGEISPSRTEVRLFPLEKSNNAADIKERFGILYNNGDFRSDIIYNALKLVESINPSVIDDFIKNIYGQSWYEKLKTEYKISNFDSFSVFVHKKFVESAYYEFTNRISDIKDLNYGKPRKTAPTLQLSENTIIRRLSELIVNSINFYLMQKDEQLTNTSVNARIESLDDAPSILQSKSSDIEIETKIPELKIVTIEKPEQSEKKLGFIKKLKGETPVTEPEPKITFPDEKENPATGEVITIEQPPIENDRNELPIIIETPTGGGGGGFIGGGGFTEVERGDGRIGRDRIYEGGRENIQ